MRAPRSARVATPSAPSATIDGEALARAFAGGAAALDANAAAIDAINVFPVPDGDTGTNMSSTMRAAVDEVSCGSCDSVHDVAAAAARGALMGAKGNSGVILSQILHGFADMPQGAHGLDGRAVADALERGRAAAYRVVSEPKEGTILTAIAAAADAAGAAAGGDADHALASAVDAAHDAVARTPELLPVLKEAGVVDSGAQGLYVLLDGMLKALRGETPARVEDLGRIDASFLAATQKLHEGDGSGYCTEFVVEGSALDAVAIRADLAAMGESVLVVGGPDVIRVHLHTEAPEGALAYGSTIGAVSQRKVDDLRSQIDALARHGDGRMSTAVGVVAVAPGDGFDRLFRSIGAREIVRGGQTMNPSAGEIRDAIERTGAAHVIVVPNNSNVIMAARQAATMSRATHVHVVPSVSVPQGVSALVAINPDAPFDDNATAMDEALRSVRSAEITRAARATRIAGRDVAKGTPIAIIDGELALSATAVADAVRAAVAQMIDGRDAPLVTLYFGEGEDETSADAVASQVRGELPCEVETVAGGQPHYAYLIGVE